MISSLLILLLASAPAQANRGREAAEGDAKPAYKPLDCSPENTESQKGYAGYAIRPSADLAYAAAREDARRKALSDLQCLDAVDHRCAASHAQVFETRWEQRTRPDGQVEVCAHTGVRHDALIRVEGAIQKINAEFTALVAAVPQGLRIAVPAPHWDSGCDGGTAGRALHQRVLNLLRQQGVPTTDSIPGADATLLLTLSRRGASVSLDGQLEQDGASQLLGGTTFPASLYNIGDADHTSCMRASRLGLPGNHRPSASGATIHAQFVGGANDFCSGQTVPLRASINTPNNEQAPGLLSVFSIESDGTVWLLERTPRDAFSTDAFFQTPGPGNAREAVLLVASPTRPPLPNAQAPCRMPGTIHPGIIPDDAAATLLPYTVHPPSTHDCGELSDQARVTLNEIAAFKRIAQECR